MIQRKLLFSFLILLFSLPAAKAHVFDWAAQFKGDYWASEALGIVADAAGNSYCVGVFGGRIDMDPGTGAADTFFFGSTSGTFIVKLDPAGRLVWALNIAGSARAVDLDEAGSVYVTGAFGGKVDFDPGPDTAFLSAEGGLNGDVYVLKLGNDGAFQWVKHFAGGGNADMAYDIAVAGGFVYTTGWFQGKVDFDPSVPDADTFYLTAGGGTDIFISKLDTAGAFVWAAGAGGPGNDLAWAIAADDAGNVYTTGLFRQTADFDPGAGTHNLTARNTDIFILKLDAAGNFAWANGIGGAGGDEGRGITVDRWGNLYVTGRFRNAVDFDPDPANSYILSSGSSSNIDAFLARYTADGRFVWVRQIGGDGEDNGADVSTDAVGHVFVTGHFEDSAAYDVSGAHFLASDNLDVFLIKSDSAGNLIWAESFGGTGWDYPEAISVNRSGHVYSAGVFEGLSDFDPGAGSYMLDASQSGLDPFVHKLFCNDTNSTRLTVALCNESYAMNGEVLDRSGIYTWVYPNAAGCDSTVTLDLTISRFAGPSVDAAGDTLFTAGEYSGYQWMWNDTLVTGATGPSLLVKENGAYRVAVLTAEGCRDTSAIYRVTNVGVPEQEHPQSVHIYPNPASEKVFIQSDMPVRVMLTDLQGRCVFPASEVTQLSLKGLAGGLYVLHVFSRDGVLIGVEKLQKHSR